MHTFGIRVPRSVEEALKIDRETCTNFWVWGNSKGDEKYKARILLLRRWRDSPHSIQVNKMSLTKSYMWTDFTRTSHFVAGGHMIHPLAEISYSSVVLHDSVITFLLMVINDIDLLATDIGNAYFNAIIHVKKYIYHRNSLVLN